MKTNFFQRSILAIGVLTASLFFSAQAFAANATELSPALKAEAEGYAKSGDLTKLAALAKDNPAIADKIAGAGAGAAAPEAAAGIAAAVAKAVPTAAAAITTAVVAAVPSAAAGISSAVIVAVPAAAAKIAQAAVDAAPADSTLSILAASVGVAPPEAIGQIVSIVPTTVVPQAPSQVVPQRRQLPTPPQPLPPDIPVIPVSPF